MAGHDAAPRGGTRGHGRIEREQPQSTTRALIREARRLRDRAKLETLWRSITSEARP